MIAMPHRKLTKNTMSSPWLFTAMGIVYVAALCSWASQGILTLMWSASKQYFRTWKVERFAVLFQDPMLTALTWTHLLLLDLFVARHVYLDGLQKKVLTAHSIILCFMFGPTGLLSHMLTKTMTSGRQQNVAAQPQ